MSLVALPGLAISATRQSQDLASQVSTRPEAQKMSVSTTPAVPAPNPLISFFDRPERMDIGYIFPRAALNLVCLARGVLTGGYLPTCC